MGLIAPIGWTDVGLIWVYCLLWIFIEDQAKLMTYLQFHPDSPRHRRFIRLAEQALHPRPRNPRD